MALEFTDANFASEVLKSDKPVLVDFWADWCGPCKQLSPVVEELSDKYEGQMVFAKIDTNANTATPMNYQVMALPTLLVFKDGQVVNQITGATTKAKLVQAIEGSL